MRFLFFYFFAAVMWTVHYISPQRRSLADWGCCIVVPSCFLLSSAGSSDCLVLLNFHHERPDSGLFYYLFLSFFFFLDGGGRGYFSSSSIFHFGVQGETRGRCMIIYVATRHSRLRHCSFFFLSPHHGQKRSTLSMQQQFRNKQKKGGTHFRRIVHILRLH